MAYSHSLLLPWSISPEDDRRFRHILLAIMVFTLAMGIVVPMLPVSKKPIEQEVELPPRVAKLIFEKRTEPKPPPKPKPIEKPKPEPVAKKPVPEKKQPQKVVKKPKPKPVPKVDPVEAARKKASKSGLLAMQDSLADLRDQSVDSLQGGARLSSSGAQAKQVQRSLVTSKVGGASRGINTSTLSRDAGSTTLAARTATEVVSPVVPVSKDTKRKSTNRGASRSIEEIQIVFDRNKSAIYSLYNRELRKDPTLQGKVVLRLTIAPSGKVTEIQMVSSELGLPSLEKRLVQRIKMFNFGAKAVDAVTITYPIDFLPA